MASRSAIIKMLKIAEKYDKGEYNLAAEHDILYFLPSDIGVSKEDADALDKLGAHMDSDSGGWAVFV